MNLKTYTFKILKILTLFGLITFFFLGCNGTIPGGDARKFPADPKKRVEQNLAEGRGFTLNKTFGNSGGTFEFASSNELWRASLDVIDFMPLASANYSGGMIITDWYNEESNLNDSIKISIRFLSNEIRADALKITVFSKECQKNINCKVSQSNPKIVSELKVAILKRAAQYKKDIVDSNPKRDIYTILTPDDR